MALPNNVDSSQPAGTAAPAASQISSIKQFLIDVFGFTSGTNVDNQALTYNTNGVVNMLRRFTLQEGAAIASAAALTPGLDGNFWHVTGTTGITSIASITGAGPLFFVFDGVVTITHNATSLILATGANFTTVAGNLLCVMHEGSGNYRELFRIPGATLTGLTSIQMIRKTADQTLTQSSTTLQNVTTLLAALAANEVVMFHVRILHTAASATADIKFAFTIPAAATLSWNFASGMQWTAADTANLTVDISTSGGSEPWGGGSASRTTDIFGIVVNGANAGDLQLQAAQNTSEAVDVIVKANSYLLVHRV